jgi:hypothetical protein
MTPFKILALFLAWSLAWTASAVRAGEAAFDSSAFWDGHPVDSGAREAWLKGAKWNYDDDTVVAWHDGAIFGFTRLRIPRQRDPSHQPRLDIGFARRAETRAVHAAGLFAFNRLDCSAKANYQALAPDQGACRSVKILGAMSGEFEGYGFSVVKLSSDQICSCRKALDNAENNADCNIFFGPIARQELSALREQGQSEELVEFFRTHQRKNIFGPAEFLTVIEVLLERNMGEDASVIADVAKRRFFGIMTSGQWELLGDFFHRLGQEAQAVDSYQKALSSYFAQQNLVFEDTCNKK